MADVLEGFRGVLAAHVEEDFFTAAADDRLDTISLLGFAVGKEEEERWKGTGGAEEEGIRSVPSDCVGRCDMKAQEKMGRAYGCSSTKLVAL